MTRHPLVSTLLAAALASGALAAQINSLEVDELLVVSAAGTPTENCDALRDTLNGVTDGDLVKRYLIRLEPGSYECGDEFLFLSAGMTLEGSGTWSTEIRGEVNSNLAGLLNLNQHTEVRKLRIINLVESGPALRSVAIQMKGSGGSFDEATLSDVYAIAGSEVGGSAAAVRADDAKIFVRSSTLFGNPGAMTAEAAGTFGEIVISYSDLVPAGMVSGDVSCVYCTSLRSLLDAACAESP